MFVAWSGAVSTSSAVLASPVNCSVTSSIFLSLFLLSLSHVLTRADPITSPLSQKSHFLSLILLWVANQPDSVAFSIFPFLLSRSSPFSSGPIHHPLPPLSPSDSDLLAVSHLHTDSSCMLLLLSALLCLPHFTVTSSPCSSSGYKDVFTSILFSSSLLLILTPLCTLRDQDMKSFAKYSPARRPPQISSYDDRKGLES